jgi:hypothetical protein
MIRTTLLVTLLAVMLTINGASAQAPTPTYLPPPLCQEQPKAPLCIVIIREHFPYPLPDSLGNGPVDSTAGYLALPLGMLSIIIGIIGIASSRKLR